MSGSREDSAVPSAPRSLRIAFAAGERPHLFWVGRTQDAKLVVKVLSKRDAGGRIEVLVVEDAGRARRVLAYRALPADLPSGWLAHWVTRLERALGVAFHCYDLRHVQTKDEWANTMRELGWSRESGSDWR